MSKDIDKEKRLNAIKNRIEYCEKRNSHKKILKELKKKYEKIKSER